jgi:hypothetical protein
MRWKERTAATLAQRTVRIGKSVRDVNARLAKKNPTAMFVAQLRLWPREPSESW